MILIVIFHHSSSFGLHLSLQDLPLPVITIYFTRQNINPIYLLHQIIIPRPGSTCKKSVITINGNR